jgi:hypothetical protein
MAHNNRLFNERLRLIYHTLYFVGLVNDFFHVSVVAIEVIFRLIALGCFGFYLNKLDAVLLLLSPQLLFLKGSS